MMKIIFQKNDLLTAITPAMSAVSNKNTITAIEGILIETDGDDRCIFSTYDMEKGIRTQLPARVIHGGKYIINAQKFSQIVRALDAEEITVTVDDKLRATISAARSNFSLQALPGEDFPSLPELSGDYGFTMPQHVLKKLINQTSFAVGVNSERPEFNGAFFKIEGSKLTVVACDRNRLALIEQTCAMESVDQDGQALSLSFIIPGKTLAELVKMIRDTEDTIVVALTRKHVIFKMGTLIFFSRLIEANYIDYDRIIPKTHNIFVYLNCSALRGALERASLVSEDKMAGSSRNFVKFEVGGGLMKISSVSATGSVYEELPVRHEGDEITIGFNCRFFLDALRVCDEEEIKISMSTPLMGVSLTRSETAEKEEDADDFLYFIMPIRMN